jgi:hypothetical protein
MFYLAWKNRAARHGFAWKSVCWVGVALWICGRPVGLAAGTNGAAGPLVIGLAEPGLITGTLYEMGSHRAKEMFKFRRSATRDGANVRVEQLFSRPDGSVACREKIRYRNDQLVSYEIEDFGAGDRGSILIERDPKKPQQQRILMEHIRDQGAKIENSVEVLQPNTLISDTIYPFILAHWDELAQGAAVKFHLISLDPPDTYGFRVTKDAETTWEGRPVTRIKMVPTNIIIARFIRPIYFLIEAAAPHRVFSYTGRTTPQNKVDGSWKFVEAEAVFDWK